MPGLSVALLNLKPGTGKTTSAVWLAHIFVEAGKQVLLVDADPSGSALEWSDLAHSTANAREALEGLGYDVLPTAVPRLEAFAQSFGLPIPEMGRQVWRAVAGDLIERCIPRGKVRS